MDCPPPTERLVTYDMDPAETATEAIALAFDAIGTNVCEQDTTMQQWLPADALDALLSRDRWFRLQFVLWGHPVVLTQDAVHIHAVPGE
ncbi:MAG: hypothetical protein ACOCQV_01805 [Halolamina sp.]